jgi:hypothetical protein
LSQESLLRGRDVDGVEILRDNEVPEWILGCRLDLGELATIKRTPVPIDQFPVLRDVPEEVGHIVEV